MRTFSPLSRALRARREDEKGEGGGGKGMLRAAVSGTRWTASAHHAAPRTKPSSCGSVARGSRPPGAFR